MKSSRRLRSCTSKTNQEEEIAMPDLSVDALLLVFGRLSTRDLLRGPRGVCRKWREAALHASLWRGRSVDSTDPEESTVMKVALKVVPCLQRLNLGAYLSPDNLDQETWGLAAVSECAVQDLRVSFSSPREAGRVVRRQLKNQRLRSLNAHAVEDVFPLGRILAKASGLTELHVATTGGRLWEVPRNKWPPKWMPPAGDGPESSIRALFYNAYVEDGLLEWLLLTHCATLESATVILSEPTGDAARRLVGCPALRKLETDVRKELSGLSACPLLESLTIRGYASAVPQLLPYFRAGGQLLKSLDFDWPDDGLHGSVLQLLQALASTGRAALEELVLGELPHDVDLDSALPGILRGLPRLKKMVLRNVPTEEVLLEAVSAKCAPSLRELMLYDWAVMDSCQEFCRYELFRQLVLRNPRLHVGGLPPKHHCQEFTFSGDDECDCCDRGLHPEYPDSDLDRMNSMMANLSSDDDDADEDDGDDEEASEEEEDDDIVDEEGEDDWKNKKDDMIKVEEGVQGKEEVSEVEDSDGGDSDDDDDDEDEAVGESSPFVSVKEAYEGVFGHEPHEECSARCHGERPNRWLWVHDM